MRASRRTATSEIVPPAILRPSRASGRPREERGLLRMRAEGLVSIVRCDWSHRTAVLETCRRGSAAPRGRLREGHAEILAQSLAGILLAEQAAPLQFRHDEANEVFISARDMCGGNHKAVAGARDKPLLEPVCNLLRAADDRVMH